MPSFVALDMEHCNSSYASVCSLGVARVVDSVVTAKKHFMVRPPEPFDIAGDRHLAMTGLTLRSIADGRPWADIAQVVESNIGDAVVVVHNRHADMPMWHQASLAAGLPTLPKFRVLDTLELAKKMGLPLKLNLLYGHLFDAEFGHHNAEADAVATAQVAVELLRRLNAAADQYAAPHRFKRMTLADVKLPAQGRRLPSATC